MCDKRFGRVRLVFEGSQRSPIGFSICRWCLTQCDVDHSGMGCGGEMTEKYSWCNMSLGVRHQHSSGYCFPIPKSIIPLTVGVILQPKRANSFIVGGRSLTMRSISSPPLVGPRLGLTRDSTGIASATPPLTGAAVACKRPCWLAGSDSPLAGGIGADTSAV